MTTISRLCRNDACGPAEYETAQDLLYAIARHGEPQSNWTYMGIHISVTIDPAIYN